MTKRCERPERRAMEINRLTAVQRAFFESGRTKDVNFRLAALRRLQDGIRRREKEIAEALTEMGFTVDKRQVVLKEPIKSVGKYKVTAKLYANVATEFTVAVVPKEGT